MKKINEAANNDFATLKVLSGIWKDERLAQLVMFYDITGMKRMQEKLESLLLLDRLLGIKNELMLEQDIKNCSVKQSLVIFDVLSLQKVNDAYGRNIGDSLLRKIKDWITGQRIEKSELYRIGGDEFCVSVENCVKEALTDYAETFSKRFAEPWVIECEGKKLEIFCTASIAVILGDYLTDNEPVLNLIERTLKASKERKTVTIYDAQMDAEYKRRLNFELILRRCTRESMCGFDVYYQPIAEPRTGRWQGLEALCRWHTPELGFVPPDLFITEAEKLELIGTIGYWVLETAVRKCNELGFDRLNHFVLHINISAVQFLDDALALSIINVLKKYDYPEEKLCIEITESSQFTFRGQSLNAITTLRKNGILVALDDFGTGYANFYHLKSIPADIMKIDKTFVSDIENESYTRYLFRTMTELAHTVNMKIVAEGVENKEQMDILTDNGADYLQGYFFSKPLASEELEKSLYRFGDILPKGD